MCGLRFFAHRRCLEESVAAEQARRVAEEEDRKEEERIAAQRAREREEEEERIATERRKADEERKAEEERKAIEASEPFLSPSVICLQFRCSDGTVIRRRFLPTDTWPVVGRFIRAQLGASRSWMLIDPIKAAAPIIDADGRALPGTLSDYDSAKKLALVIDLQ